MELSFELAEKEASTEFGSLVIPDGDHGPITLLTPLWLEDPAKTARIRARMKDVEAFNEIGDADQFEHLTDVKQVLIELLAECADRPDQWTAQATGKPLPVILTIFRRWQQAGQPGEASPSPS